MTNVDSGRRNALAEFEEKVEQASELARRCESMREELARLETRQAKLADLGDGHIEMPFSSFDQRYGITVNWQPLKSQKTGAELARVMESDLKHLRAQIAASEAEAKTLLTGSGERAEEEIRRVLSEAGVLVT